NLVGIRFLQEALHHTGIRSMRLAGWPFSTRIIMYFTRVVEKCGQKCAERCVSRPQVGRIFQLWATGWSFSPDRRRMKRRSIMFCSERLSFPGRLLDSKQKNRFWLLILTP